MQESVVSANDYLRRILLSPVYEVAQFTPLQAMNRLSERLGNAIFTKREDTQPVHSFKLRGAYNKIAQLSDEQKSKGVIAASAGNHAQGVALSAKRLGIKAIIVMPVTTPDIKVSAVRAHGAQVVLHGDNFDEASRHCQQLTDQHGYTMIPPFDDPDVIAGQGTIGKELLDQDSHLDAIFIPVGGGGLAAGIAVYIKQLLPHIKIIAVEPHESACLKAAIHAKEPTTLDKVGLFADGVAVRRIGHETFRLCQQYIDECLTVSSDEICAAMQDIFDDTRAVAEPSGALALAGLKRYISDHQLRNKRFAFILSGANINFHNLRYVSERSELGEKKEAILAVTIPERVGAYLEFVEYLGGRAITEFNYRYGNSERANIYVGIKVADRELELPQIINTLRQADYQVVDLSDDEIAKLHVRHMVGGKAGKPLKEHIFSFEFTEQPRALLRFLQTLGQKWNITLFHYRNHGAAYGQVLVGFEDNTEAISTLTGYFDQIGFSYRCETDNPACQFFL